MEQTRNYGIRSPALEQTTNYISMPALEQTSNYGMSGPALEQTSKYDICGHDLEQTRSYGTDGPSYEQTVNFSICWPAKVLGAPPSPTAHGLTLGCKYLTYEFLLCCHILVSNKSSVTNTLCRLQ